MSIEDKIKKLETIKNFYYFILVGAILLSNIFGTDPRFKEIWILIFIFIILIDGSLYLWIFRLRYLVESYTKKKYRNRSIIVLSIMIGFMLFGVIICIIF
ncbi:MAG: hypothetical protein ACFFBP_05655 [Promethearchaeota archaeon]